MALPDKVIVGHGGQGDIRIQKTLFVFGDGLLTGGGDVLIFGSEQAKNEKDVDGDDDGRREFVSAF